MLWVPPAAGVLETISLASAGAAAADDAILLATGHGSAKTFVEDAVSAVPGGAAIGVGKAIKYAEEARTAEKAIKGTGNEVDDLLKKSKCNKDELTGYLKRIDESNGTKYADEFVSSDKWPNNIQIPKGPSVLSKDGSIDWSQVPNGGYVLDENGNANKEVYKPFIGEILDRNGPSNGRYTSPVEDGKPFSYEQRSLPFVEDHSMYHQYEVIGDFSNLKNYVSNCQNSKLKLKIEALVERYYNGDYTKIVPYRGGIASGFGSVGGGIQYELPLPVEWLKDLGVLKQIN